MARAVGLIERGGLVGGRTPGRTFVGRHETTGVVGWVSWEIGCLTLSVLLLSAGGVMNLGLLDLEVLC